MVVLSLATALVPAVAASDLDGGLTAKTNVNLTPTTAISRSVRITSYGQTVDSLDGVAAKYIPGTGNSNTGTYSCASYVKAYYSAVCGVEVHNLVTGAKPQSSTVGCSFKEVTSGFQVGDIVYMTNSRGSGHWAIAKAVSGKSVTLIEQNWKWLFQGATYASLNRVVTYGSTAGMKVFRLERGRQPASTPQPTPSGGSYSSSDVEALLFDAQYYANTYPDLRQAYGYNSAALLKHWNISCRIALKTATVNNSMVVLDRKGAEKLTGKGDALLKLPGEVNPIRFQAPMIETADISPVVKYWSK